MIQASERSVRRPTKRQTDILQCLDRKLGNRDIAEELTIDLKTVETHLRNLYIKLGVNTRVDAVNIAEEMGFMGNHNYPRDCGL